MTSALDLQTRWVGLGSAPYRHVRRFLNQRHPDLEQKRLNTFNLFRLIRLDLLKKKQF